VSAVPTTQPVVEFRDLELDDSPTEEGTVSDPGLLQALRPDGALVETLRVVRARIESLDAERRLRRVGIVAAAAAEGTTMTALGLATALARNGTRRVLVVEAGLRTPTIRARLHLAAAPGLSDWLDRGGRGVLALRRIDPWGFHLLPAGTPQPQPSSLLESPRLSRLFDALSASFEYVIVDCPPLVTTADSVLIQNLLDGFLLVVRCRRTRRQQVSQAVSRLDPERLRGVVFNDVREIFAHSQAYRDHRG